MAIIDDELGIAILDETGADIFDEFGSGPIGPPVKNPSSWIPQPFGYGYVTDIGPSVDLTTNLGVILTTNTGIALSTSLTKVVGKFISNWTGTGV